MRPIPYTLIVVHAMILVVATSPVTAASVPTMAAECPANTPPNSFAPGRPPAGWQAFVPQTLHLTGSGMLASPPEGMEYLVPNRDSRDNQVYTFQKGDRQRWFWCSYNGGVQLARRLDDNATTCTIVETRRKRQLVRAAVQCK